MKILTDTLQVNGKWSQKRLMTFSSFFIAAAYAFLPLITKEFQVQEFVFLGFLGAGGFSLFQTAKNKSIDQNINQDGQNNS